MHNKPIRNKYHFLQFFHRLCLCLLIVFFYSMPIIIVLFFYYLFWHIFCHCKNREWERETEENLWLWFFYAFLQPHKNNIQFHSTLIFIIAWKMKLRKLLWDCFSCFSLPLWYLTWHQLLLFCAFSVLCASS